MIFGASNYNVRKAQSTDIDGIKQIADSHKRELGFLRRPSLLASIERDEIFVAEADNKIVGFVEYHHRRDEQTTLYNIVVEPDHRGLNVGRDLVRTLILETQAYDKKFILLKCPTDLASNQFYESLDFSIHIVENGKRRPLNVWRKDLIVSKSKNV
ncbi:GNAT family N-acetyltransferase [Anaerolineales bacterium HSG6]|nr:GNAT family N-acetyltransferase [Anaerolineales bacterium HSG6]